MKLQESDLGDLILHATNSETVEDFLDKVEADKLESNLSTKELEDFYKENRNVAKKKLKMNKEAILKAIKEVLTEKKATYCGRCGHTHVKGTPCPRPFKEGLSTYGDDAYFVAPNKGKMKKEDILKAVKEVLEESQTFVISPDPASREAAKKAAQLAGAKDPELYKQIDTMKSNDSVTVGEAMVSSDDRVSYLEIALGRVWNMGRGKNKIDLNSMAQELVNDMFAESLDEDLDLGHEDHEPHMIKSELYQIAKYAIQLYKMVDQFDSEAEVDFPAWWQSKITKANSMVSSAKHYLEFELAEPAMDQAMVEEKAKMYYHVLEDGGYGRIGHHSYFNTQEEAEKRADTLSDMFPESEFYVEAYPSKKEPVKVTMEEAKKELDKVGKEDKDIDNDGDVDKTDKYLKGRRVKMAQQSPSILRRNETK